MPVLAAPNGSSRLPAALAGWARAAPGLILRLLIQLYRLLLSPVLGVNCRFAPSCSAYALEAVERHGAMRGGWLAARRILRCHPWGGAGFDPVPPVTQQPAAEQPRHRSHPAT
jgi:putative membrane protein insertion efficiency factor